MLKILIDGNLKTQPHMIKIMSKINIENLGRPKMTTGSVMVSESPCPEGISGQQSWCWGIEFAQ